MARQFTRIILIVLAFTSLTGAAEAHVGHGSAAGFVHGFLHPIGGLDHVLAMIAVGLFAARLGGRALWLVPSAFLSMMVVGAALGINGAALPFVEFGIAASVIVLGTAVALDFSLSLTAAMGCTGFFALFHGHAHGVEMPVVASGLNYGLGFVLATAFLHGIGLALGALSGRSPVNIMRAAGAAMALAGAGMMAGYI